MRYIPPSRKAQGFDVFLETTKNFHNGFSFKEFDLFMTIGINKKNLMRLMNVKTYGTMEAWIADYKDFKDQQGSVQ